MEVHAHTFPAPESHRDRKKLNHLLWDFLMLFLGVFCGFLAEYQLEHKIERDKGKEYIISMIEDLETDTLNLSRVINQFDLLDQQTDTVLSYFSKITAGYDDILWRNLITGFPDFIKADKTMQQLKNSGGMRLIKNKRAADGITEYDLKYKDLEIDVDALTRLTVRYFSSLTEFIDFAALDVDRKIMSPIQLESGGKNYLLKTDKPSLGKCYNEIRFRKELSKMVKKQEEDLKSKAIDLIQFLKKEYHLK